MDGNQISGKRISSEFNSKAGLTLSEKVEILRSSLPQDKQPAYQEMRRQIETDTSRHQADQKTKRPERFKEAYSVEHTRILQSAEKSRMPPPSAKVVEENARLAASHQVSLIESRETGRFQKRTIEREYDFLKRTQPEHPMVKQQRGAENTRSTAKESFNAAAKQRGPER